MGIKEKNEILVSKLPGVFPGLVTQALKFGIISEGLDKFQEIYYFLSHRNSGLKNSLYFYKRRRLVHFTNEVALRSIIHNRNLRLYNLNSLVDPREFTFAGKVITVEDAIIEEARENIFQISFCEQSILKNSSAYEFNMWRLYGKYGKGISVLFTIHNTPINWNDFHISKVLYGDENRTAFRKLRLLETELNKTPPSVTIDLSKLLPFHKSRLYALEKEVRIIYDRRNKRSGSSSQIWFDNNLGSFPEIQIDIEKTEQLGHIAKYIEIPLFNMLKNVVNPEIPLLRIKKIMIGYNYLDHELKDMVNNIVDLCKDRLGYVPEIMPTRLRRYYFDIKIKDDTF